MFVLFVPQASHSDHRRSAGRCLGGSWAMVGSALDRSGLKCSRCSSQAEVLRGACLLCPLDKLHSCIQVQGLNNPGSALKDFNRSDMRDGKMVSQLCMAAGNWTWVPSMMLLCMPRVPQ